MIKWSHSYFIYPHNSPAWSTGLDYLSQKNWLQQGKWIPQGNTDSSMSLWILKVPPRSKPPFCICFPFCEPWEGCCICSVDSYLKWESWKKYRMVYYTANRSPLSMPMYMADTTNQSRALLLWASGIDLDSPTQYSWQSLPTDHQMVDDQTFHCVDRTFYSNLDYFKFSSKLGDRVPT